MKPQPKTKAIYSRKYRNFVGRLPCVICDQSAVGHHEQLEGHGTMGGKCCDSRMIPLCVWHHAQRHASGREFWKWWELDPEKLIAKFNELWLYEKGDKFWL
jgi:hypothetical protein